MIHIGNQSDRPLLSDRARRRLASIGVAIVSFDSDARITPPETLRPLERVVVDSRAFRQAALARLDSMRRYVGQTFTILPGLRLVSLPTRREHPDDHNGDRKPVQPVVAAMLLGREFLGSPVMVAVCEEQGLRVEQLLAQVDHATLVDDVEADRLARMIVWMRMDAVEVDRRCDELQHMSRELGECYEELSLLYRLTTNMIVDRPSVQFIHEACGELQQVVGHRWLAFLLAADEPKLEDLAGRLFTAGQIDCGRRKLKLLAEHLMRRYASITEPVVVEDVRTLNVEPLTKLARQLLVIPLVREGHMIGILFGGDKIDHTPISSGDAKLCHALANSLTIFLENTMLFEDVQTMFIGTLHALTTSIDAKDQYTRGHSERVAMMARQLAIAAGIHEQEVERIYLAALIHDLGKIGVPEAVLTKPGKLTAQEFEIIKQHPEIGARIIAGIRPMQDLVPGVLYHHERFGGGGYPHGLVGQQIPIMGRIIGLADAYDAMSSDRAYRHPMPHNQVLTEIRRCSGSQFDPQLTGRFVKLDFQPYFKLIRAHRDEGFEQTRIA